MTEMTPQQDRPIVGLPPGASTDLETVAEALSCVKVPGHRVREVCPWPDSSSVDRAISAGDLVVLREGDSDRLVIAPDAMEAVVSGIGPRRTRDSVLKGVSCRALLLSVQGFAAYLEGEHAMTAVAAMRPHPSEGTVYTIGGAARSFPPSLPGRDIIVTLWARVRDAALAVDADERQQIDSEIATGRDPFPGP